MVIKIDNMAVPLVRDSLRRELDLYLNEIKSLRCKVRLNPYEECKLANYEHIAEMLTDLVNEICLLSQL